MLGELAGLDTPAQIVCDFLIADRTHLY